VFGEEPRSEEEVVTNVKKSRGSIVEVVHEPGNGTRYHVVACEFKCGHWAVTCPEFRGGLVVLEGADIHYGYVMEKIERCTSEIDASEIAKAIAAAVPGVTAVACTDEKGKRS
jgi:hypothetical protein